MDLKWVIHHMEKGYYRDEKGVISEVKNVFDENGKIALDEILIGDSLHETKNYNNYFDYNISLDDIQFDNIEQRNEKMERALKLITSIEKMDTSYYKKWENKNGEKKSNKYKRKTNLEGTFYFYHNNVETHPHIHLRMKKKIALGKNCMKLREELNKIFKKEELIPSCEIIVKKNDDLQKIVDVESKKIEQMEFNKIHRIQKTLEKISWLYKEAESEVRNPSKSEKEFLLSKSEIVKDENGKEVKMYKSNRCFFTVEKDKSFRIKRKIVWGKEKGIEKEVIVHSINEIMSEYSKFSIRAGSKEFLKSLIDRMEKHENLSSSKIEEYREYLKNYKTVETSDAEGMLGSLKTGIADGEKINSDYKKYWRENKDSEDIKCRTVAKHIQNLYRERRNKIFEFSAERLEDKYNLAIKEIREIEKKETEEIVGKLEEHLKEETTSNDYLCEKIKNDLPKIKDATVYIKYFEEDKMQFLVVNNKKIDISNILKKYRVEKSTDFIKQNRIKKYNQKIDEMFIDDDKKNKKDKVLELTAKETLREIYKSFSEEAENDEYFESRLLSKTTNTEIRDENKITGISLLKDGIKTIKDYIEEIRDKGENSSIEKISLITNPDSFARIEIEKIVKDIHSKIIDIFKDKTIYKISGSFVQKYMENNLRFPYIDDMLKKIAVILEKAREERVSSKFEEYLKEETNSVKNLFNNFGWGVLLSEYEDDTLSIEEVGKNVFLSFYNEACDETRIDITKVLEKYGTIKINEIIRENRIIDYAKKIDKISLNDKKLETIVKEMLNEIYKPFAESYNSDEYEYNDSIYKGYYDIRLGEWIKPIVKGKELLVDSIKKIENYIKDINNEKTEEIIETIYTKIISEINDKKIYTKNKSILDKENGITFESLLEKIKSNFEIMGLEEEKQIISECLIEKDDENKFIKEESWGKPDYVPDEII